MRARQPGVIGDLLAAYGSVIYGVAYLILRDPSDAEEIVIDTLEVAWRKAHTLKSDGALRTWLLRIATRRSLSSRRRRRPAEPLEAALSIPTAVETEPSLDRLIVAEALTELPPRMRAAIALHYFADLTVRDTAHAMGVSENTVKTHLRDGIVRLRVAFEEPQRAAVAREA